MTAEDAIRLLKQMRTVMAVQALSLLTSNPELSREPRAMATALSLAIESIEQRGLPPQYPINVSVVHKDLDARNRSAPSSFGSDP